MTSDFNSLQLSDIAEYTNQKISIGNLNNKTYISTENMLPNKGGIVNATTLPSVNSASAFDVGDILVSNIRPYFKKIWQATFNGGCSNDVLVFRAKENICPKFLYYVLSDDNFFNYAMSTSKGTKMPRGDKQSIMLYKVPDFDLITQQKIAKVLSAIDDKIELNNKINENLEQQAQAIFKSWFIDFEPFGGTKPEDWKIARLTDIAEYLNGLAMQKFRPNEDEKGLPVLKIKELRQCCCDTNSDLCSENINSNYIINDGDVIFSWSGTLLLDLWCGGKCGLNQHLFKVTSKKYDKWFYYYWTKYHLDKFIAIAADKATTMGHIKREDLEKSEVLIPTQEIYKKIDNVIKPIIEKIILNRIENRNLIQLRDTLLPKLMSGEIDVSNIDILDNKLLFDKEKQENNGE